MSKSLESISTPFRRWLKAIPAFPQNQTELREAKTSGIGAAYSTHEVKQLTIRSESWSLEICMFGDASKVGGARDKIHEELFGSWWTCEEL